MAKENLKTKTYIMKTLFSTLLIIVYLSGNAQIKDKSGNLITPATNSISFADFSKQNQIRIDPGLSEKVKSNQSFFNSERCDIYVKSIRDSVEVCVYFYSKDTLVINGEKFAFKNRYKDEIKKTN